uniref:Uncharacterized protein n=1 Tax=Arundo donax TaxID=35708 RepID=A0A0A8ZZI0_ARUDO
MAVDEGEDEAVDRAVAPARDARGADKAENLEPHCPRQPFAGFHLALVVVCSSATHTVHGNLEPESPGHTFVT